MRPKKTALQRFEEKFIPEPNSGCWIWIANFNKKTGYGKFCFGGKPSNLAHRVSYQLYVDQCIPQKMLVMHRCDTPACVNPAHLFLGTHLDNMRDKHAKNRQIYERGEKHHNARLTVEQVIAIRKDRRFDEIIAREYGISKSHVNSIKTRFRWGHIP